MIINIKSITRGSNTNISPLIHPIDTPFLLNGCTNTWKIGEITKDTGYEAKGDQLQADKSITGLYNFRQIAGTEKMLATVDDVTSDDTQLFYSTGTTWTEITAAETAWANKAGINVEMESFLGYCFIVGYGATDGFITSSSLTGTTFSTVTNVTDMPKAKYVVRYKGQLWVANCQIGATNYPFRLYKSSYPTGAAITWTVATDFLDVDYSDYISGLTTAWGKMIAFTEKKMWVWDGATWNDPYETGCSAHRTIRRSGPYLFWVNPDGVWVSTGGQPQNIVGEVYDLFMAANPRNMFAEIVGEQYYLYVGNVTVNGVSYSNLVLIFDIGKSIWWARELYDTATVFAKYNDSGRERLWFGTSTGYVCNKGKYTDSTLLKDDRGYDIHSGFELAPFHLDNIEKLKKLKRIIAYANRPGGLKLKARVIDKNSQVVTEYQDLGELTQFVNSFDVDIDEGVILQIVGRESGKKEYWSFLGFAMDVDLHGNILK